MALPKAKNNTTGRNHWMTALGLVVAIALLDLLGTFRGVQKFAYDAGVRIAAQPAVGDISIIAIDDQSIANLGRWPWSRDIHARLFDVLSEASVVGTTVMFLDPQSGAGFDRLKKLRDELESSDVIALAAKNPQAFDSSPKALELAAATSRLLANVQRSISDLDADAKLAGSLAEHSNVVLGMLYEFGEPHGRLSSPLPDYVRSSFISNVELSQNNATVHGPIAVRSGIPPIRAIGEAAAGIGHAVATVENDGIVRQEPLLLNHFDDYAPSMSLLIAARSLNLDHDDIQVHLGRGINLGSLFVPTDRNLRLNTHFSSRSGNAPAFAVDSFYDVITGKIRPQKYRDRIVLVGLTAGGLTTAENLPVDGGARSAPVVRLAHNVSSILSGKGFVTPAWEFWVRMAAFVGIFVFLAMGLPRLGAIAGAVTTALALALMGCVQLGLMASQGLWIKLAIPALSLFVGYLVLTTLRYLVVERGKRRSDLKSVESSRMLGVEYQEKGQLDRAFDAFRECGNDDATKSSLYSLALDYERKRQFNKAVSVYEYLRELDHEYRDVDERARRARSLEETVMLGSTGRGPGRSLVIDDDGNVSKPTLGRYTIDEELGKGAMGIVYLGRDPKIDRVVAIKTLDFAKEFDDEELGEVKERFFREAQAAGRLRHPNIVTIYDAGEEEDLAYIAMEVLTGRALIHFSKVKNLLEVDKVLDIVAKCADALHYAHSQNVVHRDIKPGNIMYEPQSATVKITDFGIARITDTSKTKTGTVMGTPSYMSPEQLAGKKVDGRSDLFSLGVTMYLLLAGQWPFRADSLTNLMYQIANEPHPNILDVRADLPAGSEIRKVIDCVLAKDPDERYQTGAQMAAAVQDLIKQIQETAK